LENQLWRALEQDEFVLHYQPKIELERRRIVGVEAPDPLQSPELGLVPPMQFIPLMEETGMILDVGAWALDKAIEDHLRWMNMGLPAPRVAVNGVGDPAAQTRLRRDRPEGARAGAAPPGIDLEITESIFMEDMESILRKLKEIRDLGLSVAIDDFGTGYSSLGYLSRLSVQTLKIDRSFIITMLQDPDTMTVVSAIISLAHSLRLRVVAEGVDDEEQRSFCACSAATKCQGYLFSRAVPFDEMTILLKEGGPVSISLRPGTPVSCRCIAWHLPCLPQRRNRNRAGFYDFACTTQDRYRPRCRSAHARGGGQRERLAMPERPFTASNSATPHAPVHPPRSPDRRRPAAPARASHRGANGHRRLRTHCARSEDFHASGETSRSPDCLTVIERHR